MNEPTLSDALLEVARAANLLYFALLEDQRHALADDLGNRSLALSRDSYSLEKCGVIGNTMSAALWDLHRAIYKVRFGTPETLKNYDPSNNLAQRCLDLYRDACYLQEKGEI